VRRFGGVRRGAFVIHLAVEVDAPSTHHQQVDPVTLRRHGEAVAMHGMSEAVQAGSDDGPSTEDVRAGVPAGEATEAGAGATPPGPSGLSRR
jgi:hypothetical protein